jgi:hypothetical protein
MAYTTALATGQNGFVPTEGGLVAEDITITGAGDTTGTYTSQMKSPQYVVGFAYSISGQVVTLSSAALTGTVGARVIGYP